MVVPFGDTFICFSVVSFPVRITKQNLGIQYLLAVRLVRVLNILLTTMMLFAALTLLFDNEKMAFLNVVFIILFIGQLFAIGNINTCTITSIFVYL